MGVWRNRGFILDGDCYTEDYRHGYSKHSLMHRNIQAHAVE